MFQDIRRICENPDDEDREWFPEMAGSDWLQTVKFAMESFKDESFIQQFLSPRLIRHFKFFQIMDDDRNDYVEVSAIHNETGYKKVRDALAEQYNLSIQEPNIQIVSANLHGDRALTLRHQRSDGRPLDEHSATEVLRHLHRLWKFDVHLESVENGTVTESYSMPPVTEPITVM